MKVLKCSHCGGSIDLNKYNYQLASCPYCGNTIVVHAEDLGIDKTTGGMIKQMYGGKAVGEFISNKLYEANEDEAWKTNAHHITFAGMNDDIELAYRQIITDGNVSMYVCRENVALLFKDKETADAYVKNVRVLKYPTDDSKSLRSYMPTVTNIFVLKDGQVLVIIDRGSREYPLSNYMNMPHVHAAWVMSRLENICCLLQYSGISIKDLRIEDLFVDVHNHQICMYGAFWRMEKKEDTEQLKKIREIVKSLMNIKIENKDFNDEPIPDAFYEFLTDEPKKDAFEDFQYWDTSLMLSYGNRTFVKYDEEY